MHSTTHSSTRVRRTAAPAELSWPQLWHILGLSNDAHRAGMYRGIVAAQNARTRTGPRRRYDQYFTRLVAAARWIAMGGNTDATDLPTPTALEAVVAATMPGRRSDDTLPVTQDLLRKLASARRIRRRL